RKTTQENAWKLIGSDVPILNRGQEPGIDPALGVIALDKAPVRAVLNLDAALDPDMAIGLEGTDLLGIARRPFAGIELVPVRDARHLGQGLDLIAGSHGGLHRKSGSGGDDEAAECSDENFFLGLVHGRSPEGQSDVDPNLITRP